ncbi:MAG: PAS domain-containing protein [Cellvibrionaceae bacterium]|nr:PAS domain-containing protein [Cellvibrionaceae bacterium]
MLLKHFRKPQNDAEPPTGKTPLDYKRLLDNLSTAVMLVDEQLCLVYLNSACEALFEVSLDHIYSTRIDSFFHESNDALQKIQKTLEAQSQYTKRKASWTLHNRYRLTVDYTVTPLADTQLILFEIQPIDRLLQISREEAMIASQETTRNLIRGVAHEVKNPLGGIRGAAQLLDKELSHSDHLCAFQEYTQIIIAESDRLRNLVDRMLGPRQTRQFQAVEIHEVIERVIAVTKAETKNSIKLVRNYDPSIPTINGDLELLIQALLNIVRNAVQALNPQDSDNDTPTLELRTRIQRQFTIGRHRHPLVCCIAIIDNGPGIADELIEDIFYPMISGRAEGTGLGLAISQQLIQQHRGLIECHSKPGNTEFSLYLPLDTTT